MLGCIVVTAARPLARDIQKRLAQALQVLVMIRTFCCGPMRCRRKNVTVNALGTLLLKT